MDNLFADVACSIAMCLLATGIYLTKEEASNSKHIVYESTELVQNGEHIPVNSSQFETRLPSGKLK